MFIVALSVAAERLVEIIKGWIPWLSKEKTDEKIEGRRRSILQILAVIASMITASLAIDYLPPGLVPASIGKGWAILGFGLLASGGSGFWNGILTYVGKVKEVKKAEAEEKKTVAKAQKDLLQQGAAAAVVANNRLVA